MPITLTWGDTHQLTKNDLKKMKLNKRQLGDLLIMFHTYFHDLRKDMKVLEEINNVLLKKLEEKKDATL